MEEFYYLSFLFHRVNDPRKQCSQYSSLFSCNPYFTIMNLLSSLFSPQIHIADLLLKHAVDVFHWFCSLSDHKVERPDNSWSYASILTNIGLLFKELSLTLWIMGGSRRKRTFVSKGNRNEPRPKKLFTQDTEEDKPLLIKGHLEHELVTTIQVFTC